MGESETLFGQLAPVKPHSFVMRRSQLQVPRPRLKPVALAVAVSFLVVGCATPDLPPLPQAATTTPASASTPPLQPALAASPITVEEAIQRAKHASPQLHALQAAVTVARQRKSAATDFEEPEARAAWGTIDDEFNNPADSQAQWRLGARVYVPNPFLMSPRVSARAAELFAAKADLQAAQWSLECDVRRLFGELNFLREDIILAEDLLRQDNEILKDARARAEWDAGTASDVVAAAQKQLQTLNNLDLTRHQYQLAQRDLAGLLDLPPSSLQIATNALEYPSISKSALKLDPLQELAIRSRGDVLALRWRMEAAKYAYREARNLRIPWIKEITGWNRNPSDEWWLSAAVTIPVFSWTKNHAQDVLLAQCNLAGTNEINGVQLLRRELRDALDELEERHLQQARNQTEMVPLLAEMRKTVQVLKQTPSLMPSQVAATEAQFLESSRLELASRWRYHLALLNLERVMGEPFPERFKP